MEKAKKTFEAQWQEALNDAEVSPPTHVWVAIDNELSDDRVAAYKKQADFYKWVAAACLLLFALGTAIFWSTGDPADKPVIAKEKEFKGGGMGDTDQNSKEVASIVIPEDEDNNSKNTESPILVREGMTPTAFEKEESVITSSVITAGKETPLEPFKPAIPHFSTVAPRSTQLASAVKPWSSDQLYSVARTWQELPEEFTTGPLWAGVSFSSGSFDPGFDSGGDFAPMDANHEAFYAEAIVPRAMNQSAALYSPGQSVGGGLSIGKRVARRVTVSSGIQYRAFSTGSVTSQVVSDGQDNAYALTNETSDERLSDALSEGQLTYAGSQVQLANEFQYLSIPIKAGYVLLDKKFNITLNTGFSGNFRMNSKLVAENGSDDLSNDFSTSDSYQNVYFNFLTSMEFGYLFKDHYQFLLEPNYNQALTDFTSSSNPSRARPTNLGITIGFRYNF